MSTLVVYGYDKSVAAWASQHLGRPIGGDMPRSLAVYRGGEIIAAVIFSEYKHPDIHASIVSTTPAWATRRTLRHILRYPFVQLGCKRVTAVTEATNQPAREFLCRLGFRQEGVHTDATPSGDAVSYGLLARDAARWLAGEQSVVERFSQSAARA